MENLLLYLTTGSVMRCDRSTRPDRLPKFRTGRLRVECRPDSPSWKFWWIVPVFP